MIPLRIMVYRHSAFYTPVLAAITHGFLQAEGFAAAYRVMPPGRAIGEFIAGAEVDVVQSAVSASWMYLEKGARPPFVHFAQINQRDGFLVAARDASRTFEWRQLAGAKFMYVHGGQPQAMLAYALHLKGIDLSGLEGVNGGEPESAMQAFREGDAAFFHEQAPYPQQLEFEGRARVVASVGEVIGPVAFSSVAAAPEWLARPEAARFLRAYRRARAWVNTAPPEEVARSIGHLFPKIRIEALRASIGLYQRLGCWAGDIAIDPAHYEVALDVFAHSGLITRRHPYADVVAAPPPS